MENKDIEIEIKLPLKNPQEVKDFLNSKTKLISENIYQKDTYYTPKHRDFLNNKFPFEWLRLRKSKKGMFITYKHFYPENIEKTTHCNEFETKIENIETLEKIFKSLDFKEIIIVEKTRTTWIFEEVEIVIDKVTNLGYFIELETIKNFENPLKGKEYLYKILNELNAQTDKEDLRGYPFLILEKNGYKFQ